MNNNLILQNHNRNLLGNFNFIENLAITTGNLTCNICTEIRRSYYRICNCNSDILICRGCISQLEENNHIYCPYCRGRLNIRSMLDRKYFYYRITSLILFFIITISIEFILPLSYLVYYEDETKSQNKSSFLVNDKNMILWLISIGFFIIRPINLFEISILLHNNLYELNFKIYSLAMSFYSMLIYITLFCKKHDNLYVLIFMLIFIPIYVIPFALLSIILIYKHIIFIYKKILHTNYSNRIVPIEMIRN